MTRLERTWNRFWFETEGAPQMALLRRAFGVTLLATYLVRTLDLELFFGQTGLAPAQVAAQLEEMRYRTSLLNLLPEGPWGTAGLWGAHLALLAGLALFALGRAGRGTAIAVLVLHLSFLHRNMSVVYGVDLISTFYLLYACLLPTERRAREGAGPNPWVSVALRLCQIQLCVIYCYSGLEKVRGVEWYRGEALWTVISNAQLARWDLTWLSSMPLVIVAMTYATLFWEVYFPAVVWNSRLRLPTLIFGVVLHVGIALGMNLPFFALAMISTYAAFLTPAEATACLRVLSPRPTLGRLRRALPSRRAAVRA